MADVYAMGHQRATFFGTGALHTHTHTRTRTAIRKQNQWSSLHLSTIFFLHTSLEFDMFVCECVLGSTLSLPQIYTFFCGKRQKQQQCTIPIVAQHALTHIQNSFFIIIIFYSIVDSFDSLIRSFMQNTCLALFVCVCVCLHPERVRFVYIHIKHIYTY